MDNEKNLQKSTEQTLTIPVVMGCKFIRSRFRARWCGVVIDKRNRTKQNPLYLILILKDSCGNTPRKRMVKTLDSSWTIEIDKIELGDINTDWFSRLPIL